MIFLMCLIEKVKERVFGIGEIEQKQANKGQRFPT
jgi:hypothetical protein